MPAQKGFVKIWRRIWDSDFWQAHQPFDKRSAFIDLILQAEYQERPPEAQEKGKRPKRGEIITSYRKLARRWRWSKSRVFRFLEDQKGEGRLVININSQVIHIFLTNYDAWQKNKCKVGQFVGQLTPRPTKATKTMRDSLRDTKKRGNTLQLTETQSVQPIGIIPAKEVIKKLKIKEGLTSAEAEILIHIEEKQRTPQQARNDAILSNIQRLLSELWGQDRPGTRTLTTAQIMQLLRDRYQKDWKALAGGIVLANHHQAENLMAFLIGTANKYGPSWNQWCRMKYEKYAQENPRPIGMVIGNAILEKLTKAEPGQC